MTERTPVAVVLLVALVLGLFGLDRSPPVWADEVFYALPTAALLDGGGLSAPEFGSVRGLDRAFHLQPPVFSFFLLPGFALFGANPWTTRLPGLLGTLLAAWLCAALLRRSGGRGALPALGAAAVLFAPSTQAFARAGRPDGIAMAAMMGGAWLLAGTGPPSWFAAGVVLGLGGLLHPVVGVLAASLLVAVSVSGGLRRALVVGLGGAFVLALYGLWVITHEPGLWAQQFLPHILGASQHEASAGAGGGSAMLRPFGHLWSLVRTFPLAIPLFVGAGRALRLGAPRRTPAVWLLCAMPVLFSAESFVKFLVPFLVWAGLIGLSDLPNRWPRAARVAVVLVLLQLALVPGARAVLTATRWKARDYGPVHELIESQVSPGEVVVGPPEAWFAVRDGGARLLYPEPMHRVRFPVNAEDEARWAADLQAAEPRWAVLAPGVDPAQVLPLSGTWREAGRYVPEMEPFLGMRKVSYALVLFERTPAPIQPSERK